MKDIEKIKIDNKECLENYQALTKSYISLRKLYIKNELEKKRVDPYCPEIPVVPCRDEVKKSGKSGERDIFIFSIINWDFRHQRPQHIASELASKGRVFYIEMELSPIGIQISKKDENIYVVRLPMELIGMVDLYHGIALSQQVSAWLEVFYKFIDDIETTSHKSIIVQHPWWWQFIKHMPPEFQITFDCMDDISGFSNTTKKIVEFENELIESCDHLVVSSQRLYEKTKSFCTPILVRNGCALEHFTSPQTDNKISLKSTDDKQEVKIKVGYVGALAEWFDIELFDSLADHDRNIQYHICGAVTHKPINELNRHSNVHFYGEISYDVVPDFIGQMDVMIIPFRLTPIIQACDPVKFYEHCIMGVPTVATKMPELYRAGDIVALAKDEKDFHQKIYEMHENAKSEKFKNKLKQYAHDNCWSRRANHLWEKISQYPKVSIVILNYGAPEWSLGAIHSLCENGGNYPNLEIIVVDNGSSTDQLNILQQGIERASRQVDTRLIKNGENLGFSKGNNVGIKACTGEFVVLLNNDTYVAPGAIFSLIDHLQRNPKIGAVGPLTNNIGNEAKVFVDYPNVATMGKKAKLWLSGYRGMFTPLKALAYFCVAFRSRDLEEFGYLNEKYGLGMFEDDDHCNVIKEKGFDVVLAEDAFVHHHLSATFNTLESSNKSNLFNKNKKIFESRWGEWIPHVYRDRRPDSMLSDVED